jgi:hypothetical protein
MTQLSNRKQQRQAERRARRMKAAENIHSGSNKEQLRLL